MKKLITQGFSRTAITMVLLFVTFSPFAQLIPQVQAQTQPAGSGAVSTQGNSPASATNITAPAPAPTNPPANANKGGDFGCDLSSAISLGGAKTFALCLTNIVYVFTVGIGSGFAYIAAYFFDFAISISLNSGSYALTFISEGWATARDIANMAFLFILIYIAFVVMFEADTTNTVHMLTTVIVVALLVNFSFFFTRVAIDAGNILSIQFYNAIDAPSIRSTVESQNPSLLSNGTVQANINNYFGAGNSKDLTASIMGMLQLQNLFGTDSFRAFIGSENSNFMVTTIALSFLYIAAAIMFWLLTVAFVTNGVKFLMRVVILWFLIIASPLAFVAKAIPKFEDYFKQWLNALISNAIYPVAFLFIFLILTNFAKSQSGSLIDGLFNGIQSTSSSGSAVATIGYAAANVFIRLGFVICVLYIGFEASKRLSTMGGSVANHAGDWVGARFGSVFRKTGGAVGAGVPAWATRNTLGWVGDKYAKSNLGRDLAAHGGLLGRTAWRSASALGRQSFDIRGGLGALGVKETVVGKPGGVGGYSGAFDARVKRREEEAAKLKPSESKLAQAQKQVISKLSTADKDELAKLATKYSDVKEAFEGGGADRRDVKDAKRAFDDKVKALGIIKESREIAGYKNDKTYAGSIEKKTWRNIWGAGQGTPGWIWAADKEAAEKIRGAKNDADRVKNVLAGLGHTYTEPPPAAAPAAPGAGGAPGAAPLTRQAMERSVQGSVEKATASLIRGIDKKIQSTPLWQARKSSGSNSDRALNEIREEMKQTRKILKKGLKERSESSGSETTRPPRSSSEDDVQ